MTRARSVLVLGTLVLALALAGCADATQGSNADPNQVDSVEAPTVGLCRDLTPEDVAQSANASRVIDCAKAHNAQTFAVGPLPDEFEDADLDDEETAKSLGRFAYSECASRFMKFLGADESLVLRTVLSWAWFRPSDKAWSKGARWYRCDVVGGGEQSAEYVDLPENARGLLQGRPDDRWMVCARGASVSGSVKLPCTEGHDWRAVTTIKLGEPGDDYLGDRLSEVRSRDYCSKSVGAWLNYPVDFDYGYTYFHEAEWLAGNRRSICWAKTSD